MISTTGTRSSNYCKFWRALFSPRCRRRLLFGTVLITALLITFSPHGFITKATETDLSSSTFVSFASEDSGSLNSVSSSSLTSAFSDSTSSRGSSADIISQAGLHSDHHFLHIPYSKQDEWAINQTEKSKVVEEMLQKFSADFNQRLSFWTSPWKMAASWVTTSHILPESTPELGGVLHAMTWAPIVSLDFKATGSQFKLFLRLAGGQLAVFKPKRYERSRILEGPPVFGRDRHNGELAAFHLSRILGLRKTPLVAGRTVSLKKEILKLAPPGLLRAVQVRANKVCYYSIPSESHKASRLCPAGDVLEGAVILWLPPHIRLKTYQNPWCIWVKEINIAFNARYRSEPYCRVALDSEPFNLSSHVLLDLVDAAIFDFLLGNADRHHFELAQQGPSPAMLVMLDNGKSFGHPFQDEDRILGPIEDCCRIRQKTWQTVLGLQGGVLSAVLMEVLEGGPLHPVLTPAHYAALDRRLGKVVDVVNACVQAKGAHSVFA